MPELPEVETMRRTVLPIVGRRIAAVERVRCRRRPIAIAPAISKFSRRVVGQRVAAVERVGKRVLIRLERDDRIVLEPRMTGLVLLTNPPTREHLRFRLLLDTGLSPRELLFWDRRGLGSVYLVQADEFSAWLLRRRLGPDALSITLPELHMRLAASRRAIKVALLDQQALAGVGNLYASEVLHRAGVRPTRRCCQLKHAEWAAVHACLHEVLREAIRYEGSTLSDGTYRNALNLAGSYQNHHRVYDRAGKPCLQCAAPILRLVQAQRSTFYCARCQR